MTKKIIIIKIIGDYQTNNMNQGQYVIGTLCPMGISFMGQVIHCEKDYLKLTNAYVIGDSETENSTGEDYFNLEIKKNTETISGRSESFVISGNYIIMSISEEDYNDIVGIEGDYNDIVGTDWVIPQ